MKRAIFIVLVFMCLVCPASADDTDEWITVEGVSDYTYTTDGSDTSVAAIRVMDMGTDTSFTLQTQSSILEVDYSTSYLAFVDYQIKYTDTLNQSVTWYNGTFFNNPLVSKYVSLDSQGGGITHGTFIGSLGALEIKGSSILRVTVAPPVSFSFSSNEDVTLQYYVMHDEDLMQSMSFTENLAAKAIAGIALIPFVGTYLVQGLTITGGVMALFIRIATIVIGSSVILFLAAEMFILMRATVVAQRSKQATKRISNSIQSIIDDNAALIRFVIDAFTKLLELLYSAVRAVGSWIPFT